VVARLTAALTVLVAIAATAGVAAAPAQATEGPSPYWYTGIIRSWAQGQCLDSNDNGDVYTLPCNGGQYQQWHITIQNHPQNEWATVWLQNVRTGRFLEPICDTCDSWQPGVDAVNWLPAQGWLLFPTNANWSAWRFAWNPGITQRCLDANVPGQPPYISFTDWQPDPRLPPDYCSSNYQDWKLGF
jgi:hypothetical protein